MSSVETLAKVRNAISASFKALNDNLYNITPLESQHDTSVLSKAMYNIDLYKVLCWFSGSAIIKWE